MFKHFRIEEFACKCGCGQNLINQSFVAKLDDLREELGFPLPISSGYRCPDHNRKVSFTGEFGPHTTGKAADVKVDRLRAYELLAIAAARGFTGIGIQQKGAARYIHLDTLENDLNQPRPTIWSY